MQPVLQRRLDLDTGLEHPFAENVLRAMDADGKVGLRNAPDALLAEARERTRGYPRALEHLFGILSADRDTSLQEILDDTRQLLPEKVVTVLVGEAFNRLDSTAQGVMQALATYRYPVPAAAVDYLLQPYVPGVDSGPVLRRLVNMQFVRQDAGRYHLHQVDRDYAVGRIAAGEPADREAKVPPLTRFALQHRAAEWFKQSRKPREAWRTLEDLAAQLSEFELRCDGEDYDTAADLLLEIDDNYLTLWGHFRLVIELHERLSGRIADPALVKRSLDSLGSAYHRTGQYPRAITCHQQALRIAREHGDRWGEGVSLGNLGNCYAELGQMSQAIECYEQVLVFAHDVADWHNEAVSLGNLGSRYSELGQTAQAIDYYERALNIVRAHKGEIWSRNQEALHLCNLGQRYAELGQTDEALRCFGNALAIAKEIGYRLIQVGTLTYMGDLGLDQRDWEEATRLFQQAIEIADDTTSVQFQNHARKGLAQAYLGNGELVAAREMAEAAQ